MDTVDILVKYHNDNARPIAQAHPGEWVDCRAVEDVELKAGDFTLIDLGISVRVVQPGYEVILAPRSSTFKKYGILQTNSIGVIDETYCGDGDIYKMPVYATRDTYIRAGERIAQFRVQKNQGTIRVTEVDHLSDTNRGGFGSTDEKK